MLSLMRGAPQRPARAGLSLYFQVGGMMDGSKPKALSTPLRVVGGIVILAAVTLAVLVTMQVFAPRLAFHSGRVEDLLVLAILTSSLVSGIGGLWMLSVTKNPWWILALLPILGVVGLWLLISQMAVTLH
ncbi:hypothetical protein [Dokdonella soli]|uniref:hypothetical protein n=1 Tax=Dokdonella soli TaxID=529810 RepID=UPI00361EA108